MWISKNCLLPTWVLASVVAADAFIPVSGLHHHSKSIASNFLPLSTTGSCRLKSVETSGREEKSSAEEIPRGGSNVLKDKPPAQPTWKDYRKFAIPCLALWVAQPLLSLVDTSFVGLSAGAAESATQLAALGPATTFFDGATYLFAFLNVATTNLYSSAIAQKGEASDQAEAVVTTASRVALRCGIGIMLFLWAFARPLLALYIGTYRIVSHRIVSYCIMSNRLVKTATIFYYYIIFAVLLSFSQLYPIRFSSIFSHRTNLWLYCFSFVIHPCEGHGPDDVPALLDSAVAYVKIRAFSLPTSLLLGVIQSALLGAKDSVTPLIAILYSTVVNLIGDFLLVKIFGMGLRGAAIATLVAQLGT
jgi:Na+-driven multidrug efflux pump